MAQSSSSSTTTGGGGTAPVTDAQQQLKDFWENAMTSVKGLTAVSLKFVLCNYICLQIFIDIDTNNNQISYF